MKVFYILAIISVSLSAVVDIIELFKCGRKRKEFKLHSELLVYKVTSLLFCASFLIN